MFTSKCAKCGKYSVGWPISMPESQRCRHCGSNLAIHDEIVELNLNYAGLLQPLDTHQAECQEALGKPLAIYLNGRLPSITSTN